MAPCSRLEEKLRKLVREEPTAYRRRVRQLCCHGPAARSASQARVIMPASALLRDQSQHRADCNLLCLITENDQASSLEGISVAHHGMCCS